MNRPWKRLALGLALLVLVMATVVLATSSALAFTIGTDQSSAANGNSPSNTTGSLSALSIRPASSETFTAKYTYAVTNAALPSSIIRVMYQQWRQDQQNDWFYLYAAKTAGIDALTAPTWNIYYYTPGRGAATLSAGVANNVAAAPATNIYLGSGTQTTDPAFIVDSVVADAPLCPGPAACTATFSSTLRWGIAQQGFRAGSMTLLQAVESHSTSTATVGSPVVYYDSWEPPVPGGTNVVTLADTAPTQAATGVTNATGTRQANLGVPYSMTQTVSDVDGDLSTQSLLWVFTSGPNTGQWFTTGVYSGRAAGGASATTVAGGGTGNPSTATAFYQDWRTAQTTFSVGSGTTIGYFTQLTVGSPVQTTTTLNGGAVGVTSQSVTYSFIYNSTAAGAVNVFGGAGDWHGAASGFVLVGTQTIT
jgi:hypothetical protein